MSHPFVLQRPLLCFDLETTGIVPVTDRIWQIGLLKIYPDGKETAWETFVNPQVDIPTEVSKATRNARFPNGIANSDLISAPTFKELAPMLIAGFTDCDLAGYNIRNFDIPLLLAEFTRAGYTVDLSGAKIVDAYRLYLKVRPRNFTAFLEDMLGEHFADFAHDAMADAAGTWRGLKACLEKYPLPRTPAELHDLIYVQDGDMLAGGKFYFAREDACINFGKYKGTPLRRVPREYLEWVVKAEFTLEVKMICENALKGVYPRRS